MGSKITKDTGAERCRAMAAEELAYQKSDQARIDLEIDRAARAARDRKLGLKPGSGFDLRIRRVAR